MCDWLFLMFVQRCLASWLLSFLHNVQMKRLGIPLLIWTGPKVNIAARNCAYIMYACQCMHMLFDICQYIYSCMQLNVGNSINGFFVHNISTYNTNLQCLSTICGVIQMTKLLGMGWNSTDDWYKPVRPVYRFKHRDLNQLNWCFVVFGINCHNWCLFRVPGWYTPMAWDIWEGMIVYMYTHCWLSSTNDHWPSSTVINTI